MVRRHGFQWCRTGAPSAQCVLLAALVLLAPAAVSAQSMTITGTVTNTATGLPVNGVSIVVVSPFGVSLGSVATNASGIYSVPFLPAGTYYLYTANNLGLIDEFFNDVPCPTSGCNAQVATGSTPITGTPGSTRTGNFALQPGGSISGTVRSIVGGALLANVQVAAFVNNVAAGYDYTDGSGAYTIGGLPSGNYVLATYAPADYVGEFFDDVPCVGTCDPRSAAGATAIPVTAGAATANRNVTLAIGGRITGTITDAGTGAPVQNVQVRVYARTDTAIVSAGSALTDAAGHYAVTGLTTGTFFAFTSNNVGYIDEVFDDLPCWGSCGHVFSGVEIPVTLGATTADRNFALARGGTISGTVRHAGTAAPLASVTVDVFKSAGFGWSQVGGAGTTTGGTYSVSGLPTGTYFVSTRNGQGFIDEVYDNVPCVAGCVPTQGQPVAVVAGATVTGRDFGLTPGGQITGVVTSAATATPLANVTVAAVVTVPNGQQVLGAVFTNGSGAFTISGLAAGSYYLMIVGNPQGLVNQVFNTGGGVACLGSCSGAFAAATGTPIVVTAGATVSGRNFALPEGGRITAIVSDAVTQARLPGVSMRLYANMGGAPAPAGTGATDALGQFVATNLPPGQYFLASAGGYATQHVNEIFDNIPCLGPAFCDPAAVIASGTPIGVTANVTATRTMALSPRQEPPGPPLVLRARTDTFVAQFTWFAPSTGGAPASYRLEAGVAPGTTLVSLPATGTTLTVPGVPPGRFFVRVRGVNAFGIGPPSAEVEFVVAGNGSSPPGAPEQLSANVTDDLLALYWQAPVSGGPVAGYQLEAGTASGLANIGVVPVGGRSFSVTPVPSGFYFLRVRGVNGAGAGAASNEVMARVGSGPSPPDAPGLSAPALVNGRVTLTWSAPAGPVSGYVIEAGSASGLANLAAFNTGTVATSLTIPGVPPGTYFVRVRAGNALGVSVVSNEIMIVVP